MHWETGSTEMNCRAGHRLRNGAEVAQEKPDLGVWLLHGVSTTNSVLEWDHSTEEDTILLKISH